MKDITITCDRCGKVVNGIIDETTDGVMTGGYYDVAKGYWSKFARWEEAKVCDACMFECPKYQEIYGKFKPN